jgi:hypothetical protein
MRRLCLLLFSLALVVAGVTDCVTAPEDRLSWEISPDRAETQVDGLVPFQVKVHSKHNINSDLELEILAPDVLYADLPATVGSTQKTIDGSVYVLPAAEVGAYEVKVRVREAGGSWSAYQSLLILVTDNNGAPDFSLEVDPLALTFPVEVVPTSTFFVRPLGGFTGTVTVAVTGLTDDLSLNPGVTPGTLAFGPTDGGQGGTFVVRYAPNGAVQSPVTLTVTASSGAIVHTRTITVTINTP